MLPYFRVSPFRCWALADCDAQGFLSFRLKKHNIHTTPFRIMHTLLQTAVRTIVVRARVYL